MADTSTTDVTELQSKLQELKEEKEESKLRWLYFETQSSLSPVLLARNNEEKEFAKISDVNEMFETLENLLKNLFEVSQQEKNQLTAPTWAQ